MDKKNGKTNILALICIIISSLLIGSMILSGYILEGPPNDLRSESSNTSTHSITNSEHEPELVTRGTNNSDDDYDFKSLRTFNTGGTRVTIRGDTDGKLTYIAIPPDAEITQATMSVVGKMPETINKLAFGGRHSYISGADFNLDGNLDIITTDKDNHSFYILLNDGKSHLHSPREYSTGDLPLWGTINDFNNDGYPDVAFVNQGGDTLTVYQNSAAGDGRFEDRQDYKIGDWPRAIASSDINNDGWIDIVSITSNDYKLWLNLNQKNNTIGFFEATNITVENSPVGMACGDLNNDGLNDIVIINVGGNLTVNGSRYYYTVSVLLNKGNAEFLPREDYIVGKNPAGVVINDFNNDGWLDIATSNRASNNISVLINKGQGKFSNSVNYSLIVSPYSGRNLRSGDIDGDGDQDIVSIASRMNTVQVLKNRGDGTFQEFVDYIIPNRPVDLFLGDLDNDGDLDITLCSQTDGSVSVVSNNGDGAFSTFEYYFVGTRPMGIANGDFDSDGDLDLASVNYLSGSLTIQYNDGKGNFPEQVEKPIAVEPFALTVTDFNNDGYLDIATADEALFKIVLVPNEGAGKFNIPTISYDVGGFPYSIMYHDLNGDGENEFITTNNHELSISILRNLGNGSYAPHVEYPFDDQHPFGLAVGDLDGDGDEDIICSNYDANLKVVESNISIIWNDGNGTFSSHVNYAVGTSPRSVRVSDIDLDGDLDLVVANEGSNSMTTLMNLDNTSFGARRDYPVGLLPSCVYMEDLDMDGDPDAVITNQANNSISILYNLGNGTFAYHLEYLMGAFPIYVTIADLNNDGNLDIATSNILTHTTSVRMDIHYPGNISLDIGADGSADITHYGTLSKTIKIPDFSEELESYLSAHGSEVISTPSGPTILIPINVSSKETGIIELLELEINYLVPLDFDGDFIEDRLDSDDDNDGLPDDWEEEYELNTKNPADAQQDPDNDGLINLEEYLNETYPTIEDTDSDMLTDAEEVKIYHTDPTRADTDGDDVNDGVEVDEGTDPLDVKDYPEPPDDDGVCFTPGFTAEIIIMAIMILLVILATSTRRKNHR